jgi:hypothetical protein
MLLFIICVADLLCPGWLIMMLSYPSCCICDLFYHRKYNSFPFPPIKRASLCIMHLCIAIEYHWISIWQLEPGLELSTCRNTNAFLYYLCCWFIVSMVTFIMMLSYPSWSFCDLCFTMILPAAYYRCEHRCCSWSHTSYWQPCTWSKNPFFWKLSVLITCIACKSHIHFDDDTHAHTIMLFKPWLPECVELVHTFVLCDKWVFNF